MRHTLKESILEGPVHSYACRLRAASRFAHLHVAVCDTRKRTTSIEEATVSCARHQLPKLDDPQENQEL